MQAIYDFDGDLVDWGALSTGAGTETCELETPWRWADWPALGDWILDARKLLRDGGYLDANDLPAEVRIQRVTGLREFHPRSRRAAPALLRPLRALLRSPEGSTAILARNNSNALGVRVGLQRLVHVYEGAEPGLAYRAIENAMEVEGRPRELSLELLELLSGTCTGLDKRKRQLIDKSLGGTELEAGQRRSVADAVEAFRPVYEEPTAWGLCRAARRLLQDPPGWLKIHLPEALRCLAQVQVSDEMTPRDRLEGVVRYRKMAQRLPRRCVTTIHKSKGREFDHVIVPCAGMGSFPDDASGRRLLYVALSRARKRVTILTPDQAGSLLVRL